MATVFSDKGTKFQFSLSKYISSTFTALALPAVIVLRALDHRL